MNRIFKTIFTSCSMSRKLEREFSEANNIMPFSLFGNSTIFYIYERNGSLISRGVTEYYSKWISSFDEYIYFSEIYGMNVIYYGYRAHMEEIDEYGREILSEREEDEWEEEQEREWEKADEKEWDASWRRKWRLEEDDANDADDAEDAEDALEPKFFNPALKKLF